MSMQSVRVRLDDSPLFEAVADLDDRWNGFLRPRFTLDQVREVATHTQQLARECGRSWDSVHVVDMTFPALAGEDESRERVAIVMMVGWAWGPTDRPSQYTTIVDPDEDGLYDLGGGSWAWSHVPEPGRVPVEELQGLAGRQVHFVGEFEDPWDLFTHKVVLNDWREHYTSFNSGKSPAENSYFGISEAFDVEWDEAAMRIDDLPVCFVMAGDMELGLCPTSMEKGWQWSLVEAFTRLGVLPPTSEMYLPDEMDIPRSAELTRYLLDAFTAGVAHEVKEQQSLAASKEKYLSGVASKVLIDQ
ncbi:hypothetical protein [Streptomyces sp. NPDC091027]|uniref:hypothetical protein n=1 Tax=Streptomyces sp. NPDC091027 TaxID=3365971 RepID=UPI00382155B5